MRLRNFGRLALVCFMLVFTVSPYPGIFTNIVSAREADYPSAYAGNAEKQPLAIEARGLRQAENPSLKNRAAGLAAGKIKNKMGAGRTKGKDYVEGEILVKYKKNRVNLETAAGRTRALNFNRAKALEKKEEAKRINVSLLKIKDNKTVEEKMAELKNDPDVEYVEPNYKRYPALINSDDTYGALLWGLDNTGQTIIGPYGADGGSYVSTTGNVGADISAPEAWDIGEGANATSSVIVAVIDTGVAYNHPDLADNMWDGSACVGADDNGDPLNGGCQHGYDYEDNDRSPLPTYSSHGTHVAGIIAAGKNNGKGVIGVAPNAKIMALKYDFTVADEIKAIDFAMQNGAKIINASWGAYSSSSLEFEAISRFGAAGGIFIAAADNESSDNDEAAHFYPSDYELDNIISVAATDQNDNLAVFSNYGAVSVDVGAPGANIYSAVADAVVMSETFESVITPNIPAGWTKGGATRNLWQTRFLGGAMGNVLYGDGSRIVGALNKADAFVDSLSYDLSAATGAAIDFWTACDTEYTGYETGQIIYDYMALEYSGDGVNFDEIFRWYEPFLDWLNGDSSEVGSAIYHFADVPIASDYFTNNFKFRLRWVDASPSRSVEGCLIDDIKITKYSDGSDEQYGYENGTSMAAPYVAGLMALIEGYNPNLSPAQVKNIILTTGDALDSLAGKTVTGKRINAQKALQAANPDIALLAVDKDALTDDVIKGANIDLSNITEALALLPTAGFVNSSTIVWSSSHAAIVSDDGQTVVRPAFGAGNAVVTLSATISKGALSDTKTFVLTVLSLPVSVIATVTSEIYAVSASGTSSGTIANVPFGTAKSAFLVALAKGEANQTWIEEGLSDPVATGNTLTVIAQDGTTTVVYTVAVLANPAKAISAFSFAAPPATGLIDEAAHTIAITVPLGTDVTVLAPTLVISGESVSPASGAVQDFTAPVVYTVTAADGSTQDYTVTVIVAQFSDLTALTAAIAAAQSKYDAAAEGNLPGQYPAPFKADLRTAIDIASALTNGSAQSAVDAAVIALNSAVAVFETGRVPDTAAPVITLLGMSAMNIYAGSTYVDAGATALDDVDGDISARIVTANAVNTAATGTYAIVYNVSDAAGNSAIQVVRTVSVLPVSGSAQLLGEHVVVSTSTPEILVGDNNLTTSTITIPDSVSNATINVNALATSSAANTTATMRGAITINVSTTVWAVRIEIPANIQIAAGISDWNGIINVPQVRPNSAVTVTPDSGNTAAIFSVIEIGSGETKLTFNKAARLVFSGQAGKDVGYVRGGVFRKITALCSADAQVVGDALVEEGDCKINVGADLIVWTKHFTSFVTYTQTAIPPVVVPPVVVTSGGGGGGDGGHYSPPAPDTVAPVITLSGTASLNLFVGDVYSDAGATASDNKDGNISAKIAVVNPVNTAIAGTYTITYNVSDVAGNRAAQVIRTVVVAERPAIKVEATPTTVSAPASVSAGKVLGEKITKLDTLIATLKPNKRAPQVKELQAELKKLGFFPQSQATTDFYGKVTAAGVKKYKNSKAQPPALVQPPAEQVDFELDELVVTLQPNKRAPLVKKLQAGLQKLGLFPK